MARPETFQAHQFPQNHIIWRRTLAHGANVADVSHMPDFSTSRTISGDIRSLFNLEFPLGLKGCPSPSGEGPFAVMSDARTAGDGR